MQHTSNILMIRPVQFGFNAETAVNNLFQVKSADSAVQEKAGKEFETLVELLRQHGIDVTVVDDTAEPHTPDSIFPNNWLSFHEEGSLLLYPMFAENRRLERKQTVLDAIQKKFKVRRIIDLSYHEKEHLFLEGTGSMVLDRENKIAYACLSPRTDKTVLEEFCKLMGYTPIAFTAVDAAKQPIYHTNVMMCVADEYALICIDTIPNSIERNTVVDSLKKTGKQVIAISIDQMNHFAGNMLQVHNAGGNKFLVMSSQAFRSVTAQQLADIEYFNPIIHSDIATIESNGGGSARCMMAEVFLEIK